MPTNKELLGLLTKDQLNSNISKRKARVELYEKGINVLRNTRDANDPFISGRIDFLSELIEDDKEAISNWTELLEIAES